MLRALMLAAALAGTATPCLAQSAEETAAFILWGLDKRDYDGRGSMGCKQTFSYIQDGNNTKIPSYITTCPPEYDFDSVTRTVKSISKCIFQSSVTKKNSSRSTDEIYLIDLSEADLSDVDYSSENFGNPSYEIKMTKFSTTVNGKEENEPPRSWTQPKSMEIIDYTENVTADRRRRAVTYFQKTYCAGRAF